MSSVTWGTSLVGNSLTVMQVGLARKRGYPGRPSAPSPTRPCDVGHARKRPQHPSDPLDASHSPPVDAMQVGKHRSRRAISAGQPPFPPKSVGIGWIGCHQENKTQPPGLKSRRGGDYRDRRPLGFGGTPMMRATEARNEATAGGGQRGAAPPN